MLRMLREPAHESAELRGAQAAVLDLLAVLEDHAGRQLLHAAVLTQRLGLHEVDLAEVYLQV